MRNVERLITFGAVLLSFVWAGSALANGLPKNIIVMMQDGGGFEQYELARLVSGGPLAVDALDPTPGASDTLNVFGGITDSAAGATSPATGCKTANGNVSMAEDDQTILPTNMEVAQAQGKAVGLISDVYMCDATPGAWLSHSPRRSCSTVLPGQIDACPDVYLGPGDKIPGFNAGNRKNKSNLVDFMEAECGYDRVHNDAELAAYTPDPGDKLLAVIGGYTLTQSIDRQNDPGDTTPTLAEFTAKALELLSLDPDGFFLMVEGGLPDWGHHNKDVAGSTSDTLEFDAAIQVVHDFAVADGETAVVITSDHECGGLLVGNSPNIPFIQGITASTDWMAGQVFREGEDPADILQTYAGVTDLTQAELDVIAQWPESGIADALTARANVQWILPTGQPAIAPEEGKHREFRVPTFAFGPGTAGLFEGDIGNDDIGKRIFELLGEVAPACPVCTATPAGSQDPDDIVCE